MYFKLFKSLILILALFFAVALPGETNAATSCTREARGGTFSCAGSSSGFVCGSSPYYSCFLGAVTPLPAEGTPAYGTKEYNCSDPSCSIICTGSKIACLSGNPSSASNP